MWTLTPAISKNDITYYRDFHVWVLIAGLAGWARILTFYSLFRFPPHTVRLETVQQAMSWAGTPYSWESIPLRLKADEDWNVPLLLLQEKQGLAPVAYLLLTRQGETIHIPGSPETQTHAYGLGKLFDAYWQPIPFDEDLEVSFEMNEENFGRLLRPPSSQGSKG